MLSKKHNNNLGNLYYLMNVSPQQITEKLLQSFPQSSQATLANKLEKLLDRFTPEHIAMLHKLDAAFLMDILRLMLHSRFAAEVLRTNLHTSLKLLANLQASQGDFDKSIQHNRDFYASGLEEIVYRNQAQARQAFRKLRRLFMLEIGWLDIVQYASVEKLTRHYSEFTKKLLAKSFSLVLNKHRLKQGLPLKDDKTPVAFSVLALGKLGSNELNYSSDVDLLFSYDQQGKTSSGA